MANRMPGQIERAVHPRPFAHGRSHGTFFQSSPGLLPYRDLTIWEQHKATTPERSWSQSAITCVSPLGQCLASAFPQHPFQETGVPPRSGGQKSLFAFDVFCSFREQTLIHFLVKVQELGVNQLPGVGMFDSKVQRCQNVQRSK
eukprot:symbB.v1.2.030377.t1/scaffold3415.1/size57235/3